MAGSCQRNWKSPRYIFSWFKSPLHEGLRQQSLRENPEHSMHVGAKELDSDRSPELITMSIVDVACSLSKESHDVSDSSLVTRNDKFKAKITETNGKLKQLCIGKILFLIDHSKTIKLNRSKLYVTRTDSNTLGND